MCVLFFKGYTNPLKVVYSQSKTPMSTKGASRYIPQAPDRILDAPEIVDDYCKYETSYFQKKTANSSFWLNKYLN